MEIEVNKKYRIIFRVINYRIAPESLSFPEPSIYIGEFRDPCDTLEKAIILLDLAKKFAPHLDWIIRCEESIKIGNNIGEKS